MNSRHTGNTVLMISLLALAAGPGAYAPPGSFGRETEVDASALKPVDGSDAPKGPGRRSTERRLGKLENRVGKIEKRVTTLEESRGAEPSPDGREENLKVQPLAVALVSKKQSIGGGEVGIKLVLEFKNLTSYTINGFSGMLVFKPEGGNIYTRRMSYAHPLGSGETAQIELIISSDQPGRYLKFVKARTIKVVLINQQLHE